MLLGDIPAFGAVKFRQRPAVVHGGQILTYQALHRRCEALAAGLRHVAPPGSRIALLSANRPEIVECYYGVPSAGMVLTLLNYRLHPREILAQLQHADTSVLIAEGQFLHALSDSLSHVPSLETVVGLDDSDPGDVAYERLLDGTTNGGHSPTPTQDDVAWMIYTSGTTGQPKGVMLTHRNLLSAAASWMIDYGPRPDESFLMAFPLCHVAGAGTLGYHLRGTTLVLRPHFDPMDFMESVQRHGVNGASLAPTMISAVVHHPRFHEFDLSSLRMVTYGGSSISVGLLRKTLEHLPDVELVQAYGMTELGGSVLCLDGQAHRYAINDDPLLLGAAGRPMALSAVRILDQQFNDVPVGDVGELAVRGDQVMAGYWDAPEVTAASFHGPWFLTGDLARMDGRGYVTIVDRRKDMIVTGGENVYSAEVEDVIGAHPHVLEVAVVGLPHDHWGEAVTAVVVPIEGTALDADTVIAHCRARLAAYKSPKQVFLVDELPKTVAGKVKKAELRARHARS